MLRTKLLKLLDGLVPREDNGAALSADDWVKARTLLAAALAVIVVMVPGTVVDSVKYGVASLQFAIDCFVVAAMAAVASARWTRIPLAVAAVVATWSAALALLGLVAADGGALTSNIIWLPTLAFAAIKISSFRNAASIAGTLVAGVFVAIVAQTPAPTTDPRHPTAQVLAIFFDVSGSMTVAMILGWVNERLKSKIQAQLEAKQQESFRQAVALERGEKLAAVGEMCAGIAHEVNNPLMVITGRIDQIERKLARGQFAATDIAPPVESIRLAAGRIIETIAAVRRMANGAAQVGAEAKQAISLRQVVADVKTLCEARARLAGVAIVSDAPVDLRFFGDRVQVGQILVNLVNNALDAIGTCAVKTVTIRCHATDRGRIALEVEDSGPGIPDDLAEKIFDPFFSTKGGGANSGLGLAISASIAAAHGGKLLYQRRADRTVFQFDLAAAADGERADAGVARSA